MAFGERDSRRDEAGPPVFLALETATPVCSLAIMAGDVPLISVSFTPAAGHSASLMPAVDAAARLAGAPRETWAAVAVSRGPGSFTGLRIGLATAKALALGLDVPLYGVSTLEALASRVAVPPPRPICALIDARKGQVFAAVYRPGRRGLRRLVSPKAVFPGEIPRFAPCNALFTGDGLDAYADDLAKAFGRNVDAAPPDLRRADAAAVGRLALPRVVSGAPTEIDALVPDYVRPSDAEINHGRRKRRPAAD